MQISFHASEYLIGALGSNPLDGDIIAECFCASLSYLCLTKYLPVPVFNCQVVLRFDTLSIFLLNFDVTLKFSTLTYFYINCTYEKILKSSLSVQKFNEISDTHLVDMIRQK